MRCVTQSFFILLVLGALLALPAAPASATETLKGQVLGGGAPVANSTVTLWAASAGAPTELAQTKTNKDGRFEMRLKGSPSKDAILYLVAKGGRSAADKTGGDNPAIALMTVVGNKPPAKVTINEMTTVASVITHNQYIDGAAIKGSPLALRIAAGNVPNFVDLATGDYGPTIAGALNSAQTPTMANFATLANVAAGCVERVKEDACSSVFAASKGPIGSAPEDTLEAVESVVRYPWYEPQRIFALLDHFYPYPKSNEVVRPTPFIPYLTFAPSAWVFPLKFTGGGLSGPGKLMIDGEGYAWAADNFIVGMQNLDKIWAGGLSKLAPNGKPLSPPLKGFTGGGIGGPGFGLAIDANDNVWVTSFQAKTISKFDNSGKPLSPPGGWNFDGKLGSMQGIIVAPNSDVWAVDTMKGQVVHFPKGDPAKGELLCQNKTGNPMKNPCKLVAPFGIAIDQRDNIWITNIIGEHVTRFPASDPSKVETFKTGFSGSGLAVDSLGNVWITNKLGSFEHGRLKLLEMIAAAKINFDNDPDAQNRIGKVLVGTMAAQKAGKDGGSITVLRPDGKEASFSPIYGKGIVGPWAVSVDGNDNIWISNLSSASAGIVELCGFRTENCPPGMKTGDAISPPGGYVGGGLQMQVDVGIGPAGDVWVTNNWQYWPAALEKVDEALSTLGGGQGVVVFYGMAKPVKTPMIGPPHPAQ
jgi:DNA-binding beta-propeller fold protein YncE